MKPRILIVDDEAGMRRSLAIMLRREGFEVTEAAAVADAMGRLKEEAYDLVIADLRMDPLNGLDLLTLARRYCPRCPVIIVTAFGSAEARTEALGNGAVDFLEKPLEAGVLQARIHQLLDTHGR
jgi:DNA-binding response OmpR family regulator